MKSKLRIAVIAAVATIGLMATAGAANFDHCADQLKDLGLFQGTEQGYELDRAPTRAEAATMLVRLLGKEAEAKGLEYTAPFTDLAGWEQPYVQYLYDNGLTTGATATTFEPEDTCSAQMYTTFLLRALGYSDASGADFTYAQAIPFGESIGLVDFANCDQSNFLRDHVAAMSLTALHTDVKGATDSLLDKLVADGAVDADKAESLLTFFDRYDRYTDASAQMNAATKADISANIVADVSVNGEKLLDLTMPLDIKMDMDMEQMDQSKLMMTGTVNIDLNEALVEQGAETSIKQDIAYYYTDGVYYMNMDGQKYKMDLSFEDVMAQMGDLTSVQSTEPICLIDAIDQTGNAMTVQYSASGMNALVDTVLKSMGMDFGAADISVQLDQVSAKVNVSGAAIRNMEMAMKMTVGADGQSAVINMTMDYDINKMGDTVTITLPDDLDTYEDMTGGADAPAA